MSFEGSVTAHRKKPIPGLVMQLEFFDSTGALLNILKQTIEEDVVERGDEIDFYLVCDEVPRAVSFRVVMFSGRGKRLSPHFQFDSDLSTFRRPSASLFIGARAR